MKIAESILKKLSYVKILLPTLLTIGLLITAIFIVVIPQFESIIVDRKREMIRELTNSAVSLINDWHKMELNGELDKVAAQSSAMNQIESLRYGDELKDYFWITDMHPNMIMHPYRPDLNGKDLSDFEDSHQKILFVEMVRVVEKNGEGYVDYMWQWKDDSTKIVPKLSYVKKFEPWGWVIGTGIYIEDVKHEISLLEQKIITISLIITVLSSLLLTYLAYQNLKSEKRRKEAEDELKESREKYRLLAEASGEGLIMILENQKVFYNKTIFSILGYEDTNKELLLSDIFVTYPDLQTFDFKEMRKIKDVNLPVEKSETKFKKKTGELLDVFLNISPISFLNNNGIVISVKDISRHKEIEEALDYTKEKYLALTNQITFGVFRVSPDKKAQFSEVNPALVQLFVAKDESELLTKSLSDFIDDPDVESQFFDELNKNGVIKTKIIQLKRTTGIPFTVSISAVLVKNTDNKKISIDGIIEDISEQQRSDKEKEQLISDLQNTLFVLNQKILPFIKQIPSCHYSSGMKDVLILMTKNNSGAILIKGDNDEIMGILTDHDLREKVISSNNYDASVSSLTNAPIFSVNTNSTIYDALVLFREKKVRYLVVYCSDDKLEGVLHIDDIFDATFTNYLFFIEKIESAESISNITGYRKQLLLLIKSMIANEMNIRGITNFITMISDAITKRLIQLAIAELGEPPVKFAFISMGSEGRKEQTLVTDQDNAIIYEDVPIEIEETVKKYFTRLGGIISDNLNTVGYQYCKGGIMAKNEKWCQPLKIWKKNFTSWITTANPQDLLDSKIFFDFRFISGDEQLSKQLGKHVEMLTKSSSTFFVYLSENLLRGELADSILKFKSAIDMKLLLLPVVDFARLYSLKYNLSSTNTIIRLEQLYEKGFLSENIFRNIIFSYNLLMQLRLQHQADCYNSNLPIDNSILPQNLSELNMTIIKKYFDQLGELKNKIRIDFKGTSIN